jgi:hypothetical protein
MSNDDQKIPPPPPVPETLPPPPSISAEWLKQRIANGETSQEAAQPKKKAGRPKGSKDKKPRKTQKREPVVEHRGLLSTAPHPPKKDSPAYHRDRVDRLVSQADWQKVYLAFTATGDYSKIAEETGLDRNIVGHLVDYGVMRLGLKPVREHAVQPGEVDVRVAELVGPVQKEAPKALDGPLMHHMPDVKQAVADRAIREAAAAQSSLLASVHVTDVFLGYVQRVMQKIVDPDGGYIVPDHVTPKMISDLAIIAKNLATATEKATQMSRLTAGEPTQNIALHVASFTSQMSPDELRKYIKTRELPTHLRLRGGSRDSQENRDIEKASSKVIDVKADSD